MSAATLTLDEVARRIVAAIQEAEAAKARTENPPVAGGEYAVALGYLEGHLKNLLREIGEKSGRDYQSWLGEGARCRDSRD